MRGATELVIHIGEIAESYRSARSLQSWAAAHTAVEVEITRDRADAYTFALALAVLTWIQEQAESERRAAAVAYGAATTEVVARATMQPTYPKGQAKGAWTVVTINQASGKGGPR